jgi:hypothetical protein
VILEHTRTLTDDLLKHLTDERGTVWPVLKNEVEGLLMFGINRSTQLLNFRILHNVPPHHIGVLAEE